MQKMHPYLIYLLGNLSLCLSFFAFVKSLNSTDHRLLWYDITDFLSESVIIFSVIKQSLHFKSHFNEMLTGRIDFVEQKPKK